MTENKNEPCSISTHGSEGDSSKNHDGEFSHVVRVVGEDSELGRRSVGVARVGRSRIELN